VAVSWSGVGGPAAGGSAAERAGPLRARPWPSALRSTSPPPGHASLDDSGSTPTSPSSSPAGQVDAA